MSENPCIVCVLFCLEDGFGETFRRSKMIIYKKATPGVRHPHDSDAPGSGMNQNQNVDERIQKDKILNHFGSSHLAMGKWERSGQHK